MKKLIAISILLNLGLVASIAFLKMPRAPRAAETSNTEKARHDFARSKKKQPANGRDSVEIVKMSGEKFSWRNVESADYKAYIANLRAIQCPEETVRDIIIADVNKLFAERLKPLRKPVEQWNFWKNDNWNSNRETEEFYKEQRAIDKEKRELLKELLGVDYWEELAKQYGGLNRLKDSFTESLPQEIKDQLAEIRQKFSEQENDVYRKARGYNDEDTQNDLRKIDKARRDEMAKILSPEQLLEWDLRNSSLAQNMKWNELDVFNATEEEFRAIFKAKLAANDSRIVNDDEDEAARKDLRNVERQSQEEIKTALGEERYKEFQRAQDWDYRQLARLAERRGISEETAVRVYEMKTDVQKAAREVNGDKSLTTEQRREKLIAIQQATEQEVTRSLGERGFNQWKRNAWWFKNMVPPQNEVPREWAKPK